MVAPRHSVDACRMLLRLSRMGLNTLYMDSDTMLFDDPYK
jgi:hypothetical protein